MNGNGQIDSEDTPIVNATFSVEIDGVKAFGDTTDETGNAFILPAAIAAAKSALPEG